jgi:hypothetical protein
VVEPVDVQRIATAALSAGAIVLFGALYAVLFALSRMRGQLNLGRYALLSYGFLVASAIVLANALEAEGLWAILIGVLLIGYFAAPRLIWRLNLAVHAEPGDPSTSAATSGECP